tara:strand:- start:17634 stop:18074 length:441 start_codon:yes stop_codon:yes gene_type:complete
MSKIQRDKFNAEYNMPSTKILGTISAPIGNKINKMIVSGDTSDAKLIVDSINSILKTTITDISADTFPEPFQSDSKMNLNYDEPTGLFFLVTQGNVEIRVDGQSFKLQTNKIFFINERLPYVVLSPDSSRVNMFSAKFMWDKNIHA